MGTRFVKQNTVLRRNERDRLMLVGAAALALALLIVIVIVLKIRSQAAEEAPQAAAPVTTNQVPAAIGTVALLAPESTVAAGTKLSDVLLKETYWPRNQVPAGAIRDVADLKNFYAKVTLPANMPITRDNLTSQANSDALKLKKGFRAITIEGDSTSIVEGHVLPGSRVDVILTYLKAGVKTSKIIVQNVRVVSLGGRVQAIEDPIRGVVVPSSSTVTLEVMPKDALKIQTAKSMGRISLMMRSMDDAQGPDTEEFDQNDVDGSKRKSEGRMGTSCTKGSVKIDGKQFMVDCDGKINQVMNPDEP